MELHAAPCGPAPYLLVDRSDDKFKLPCRQQPHHFHQVHLSKDDVDGRIDTPKRFEDEADQFNADEWGNADPNDALSGVEQFARLRHQRALSVQYIGNTWQ